tara:strand:+ start:3828 stop:4322 length:495 start_codon:yes stop_codon:yes gene_type:complete
MPKPNHSFSVKEMKDYIRTHKLNKPEIKLSMRRHELIAGLKKIGHWSETSGKRKMITTKGRPVNKQKAKPDDMKGFLDGLPEPKKKAGNKNLMLDAFLKRHKHVSGRSAKNFMRYVTAYKAQKTVDGIDGKSVTITIRESKDGMPQVHVKGKDYDSVLPFRLRK